MQYYFIHSQKIERPFLEAVQLTLDERYSENIEKVYKITIRFIIETVIQGYEQAEGREVNDNVTNAKKIGKKKEDASSPSSENSQKTVNAFRMIAKSGASGITAASSNTPVIKGTTNGNATSPEKSVDKTSSSYTKCPQMPVVGLKDES